MGLLRGRAPKNFVTVQKSQEYAHPRVVSMGAAWMRPALVLTRSLLGVTGREKS